MAKFCAAETGDVHESRSLREFWYTAYCWSLL